ncbi:unnamed protein product [Medioppia subpectinata]|uniref:Mitochondrial fission factor n=1 Tax=Medioppia subpectinata TaxID=1979941 RepID=A0A7R9L5M1_9ACAR|nr:unnamed protein product [Medioppia subpectinata]CAG2115963.1 unnamed protein product [Medioppia subpectinata]
MSTSSTGNSPLRLTASVDAFYDPDFTRDISHKMRVPEKIVINDHNLNGGHFDDPAIIAARTQASHTGPHDRLWMTVPERILVVGNESHMSGRGPLPEMKLENSMLGMNDNSTTNSSIPLQLSTPPHTLTLNEHTFPTVGDNNTDHNSYTNSRFPNSSHKKKRNVVLSGFTANEDVLEKSRKESVESPEYQSYFNSNNSVNDLSADESTVVLRRQVKALSRRVAAIELDNQHRHQREVLIYTLGVIYFVVKGFVWIHRQL